MQQHFSSSFTNADMLPILRSQLSPQFVRYCRSITQEATQSTTTPLSSASSRATKSYFVPRNTQGNLPVYSDIRNAGTRHLVLVRNVEGDISKLANELSQSLFPRGSQEAIKMKVQINFGKHLVISGGKWKNEVTEWLKTHGF